VGIRRYVMKIISVILGFIVLIGLVTSVVCLHGEDVPSPVTIEQQVKDADLVIEGRLEIIRTRGITITWRPEQGEKEKTAHYTIGRIWPGEMLKSSLSEKSRYYSVLFNESADYKDNQDGVWLLEKNSTIGRYAINIPNYGTIDDIKRAIAKTNIDALKRPAASHLGTVSRAYHVVKEGETLWGIAEMYYGDGTKYKDIMKANPGLNVNTLELGMRLVIP
jgi:nucleoid-associated protein YgaU